MSWKCSVIADNSGEWVANGLRFATELEAKAYGRNLHSRWMAVREHRAEESNDPVNYKWSFELHQSLPIEETK